MSNKNILSGKDKKGDGEGERNVGSHSLALCTSFVMTLETAMCRCRIVSRRRDCTCLHTDAAAAADAA